MRRRTRYVRPEVYAFLVVMAPIFTPPRSTTVPESNASLAQQMYNEIHKFALRFLSVYETEQFISSLKDILDDSKCVISSGSPYRPTKDWSPAPSTNTQSQRMSPILNPDALQTSNPPEPIYYNPVEATHPNFPPSFTSLLLNCSPAVHQAAAQVQPSLSEDADLKDQIARYMKDSSFRDSRILCYLPSVVATAIMCLVIKEVDVNNALEYQNQLLGILKISKERVNECCNLITELLGDCDDDRESCYGVNLGRRYHQLLQPSNLYLVKKKTGLMQIDRICHCNDPHGRWNKMRSVRKNSKKIGGNIYEILKNRAFRILRNLEILAGKRRIKLQDGSSFVDEDSKVTVYQNVQWSTAAPQICTYASGVLDKETQTLRIVPVTSNKVVDIIYAFAYTIQSSLNPWFHNQCMFTIFSLHISQEQQQGGQGPEMHAYPICNSAYHKFKFNYSLEFCVRTIN
ncbi:hypothetical protein ACET3Z_005623 [Daucus carota]